LHKTRLGPSKSEQVPSTGGIDALGGRAERLLRGVGLSQARKRPRLAKIPHRGYQCQEFAPWPFDDFDGTLIFGVITIPHFPSV
jgi:hypothetical protein